MLDFFVFVCVCVCVFQIWNDKFLAMNFGPEAWETLQYAILLSVLGINC